MITAHYFDGRSARLHPVQLNVEAGKLLVSAPSFERSYPVAAMALASSQVGGDPDRVRAVFYFA